MSKLTNTIRTEVDEDYFMDIADFRDYARSMMFPDPVGIAMSDELNDIVTEAVNSGKTTLEDAFKKLVKRDSKGRIDYSYSDGFDGFRYGQELCASAIPKLPPSALASDTYTTNLKPGKQKGVPYHELRF